MLCTSLAFGGAVLLSRLARGCHCVSNLLVEYHVVPGAGRDI